MQKNRVEAFSDGVIAIIVTIMVLELRIPSLPHGAPDREVWLALQGLLPQILSYLLSFVVVAIQWVNHHRLFDSIPQVDTKFVWYNNLLLFTMSLVPLPTAFLAEDPMRPQGAMFYGAVMFLNAMAFLLLRRYVELHARLLPYNRRIHLSNLASVTLYLASIPLALLSVYLSFLVFLAIPLWYFIPDRLHTSLPNSKDH